MTLATLLHAAVLSTGATYAEAHADTQTTGKPLVVLVGTDWCPACRTMKASTIPDAQRHGVFDEVSFAVVNPDQDKNLARQLMNGGSMPQLVMYWQTADGWHRETLVGAQSTSRIQTFLKHGLESTPATADSAAK